MSHVEPASLSFSFLPLGNETVASSRLRCYALVSALSKLGYGARIGRDERSDILCIQKRTDRDALSAAHSWKRSGKKLLFDIDDFPEIKRFRKGARALLALADGVTTATPEQRELVLDIFPGVPSQRVYCLPNPVDYAPSAPHHKHHVQSRPLKALWFGNVENFPEAIPSIIHSTVDVELHAITRYSTDLVRCYGPSVVFHEWSYETFPQVLAQFDVCILSHKGSPIVQAKSAHKMITAIIHGLPVIASRTPDHQRVANLAGVDEFLFEQEEDIGRLLEYFKNPDRRNDYLAKAQGVLWQEFQVESIVSRFLEVSGQIMGLPPRTDFRALYAKTIGSWTELLKAAG